MVGPGKQDFWQKVNIIKENHCILRIKKLGIILETKCFKNGSYQKRINKKYAPELLFFSGKKSELFG